MAQQYCLAAIVEFTHDNSKKEQQQNLHNNIVLEQELKILIIKHAIFGFYSYLFRIISVIYYYNVKMKEKV
jgi:hypothetical protein